MTPTDLLREAETDLAALATLPGEIRGKVKAGVAELGHLRDAIDTAIAGLTGGARATLQSLEALVAAGQQAPAGPVAADPVPPSLAG